MEEKERPTPQRLRGRGVEVSKTLFYYYIEKSALFFLRIKQQLDEKIIIDSDILSIRNQKNTSQVVDWKGVHFGNNLWVYSSQQL